jgi:DNA-binding NtrC family response regulator
VETPKEALIIGRRRIGATDLSGVLKDVGLEVLALECAGQLREDVGPGRFAVALINADTPDIDWRGQLRAVRSATDTLTLVLAQWPVAEVDTRDAMAAGAYLVVDGPLTATTLSVLISRERIWLFVALRGD